MDRVHGHPFSAVRQAGVAIRAIDSAQRHAGVLYKDGPTTRLLHLRFDYDLADETPSRKYLWIDPSIPESRLRQVSAVCRLVWRANGRNDVPFGFGHPAGCIGEDGQYVFGPGGAGLTCATFVMAVFHRAGLQLVDYPTWPIRPDDSEWQMAVLRMLRETSTQERLAEVEKDIGTTCRFRPEEIAGAATVSPIVSFALAEPQSIEILKKLYHHLFVTNVTLTSSDTIEVAFADGTSFSLLIEAIELAPPSCWDTACPYPQTCGINVSDIHGETVQIGAGYLRYLADPEYAAEIDRDKE